MRALLVTTLLSAFIFSASPADAQSRKELAAQNAQLSQRLAALENRMLTGDPAAERLLQRMDSLEASQRALTGEIERLQYERETLQEEVKVLLTEITDLKQLADQTRIHLQAVDAVAQQRQEVTAPRVYGGGGSRTGGGVYSNGSSIASPPTISGGAPQIEMPANDLSKLGAVGHDKLAIGDYTGAQTAFKQYLEFKPDAPDRGDIYFWLGESFYVKGGYADATDAYVSSMREAPNGAYAPEAMVKLAATSRALGDMGRACQTLAAFPGQFPNASAQVKEKARVEAQRSGC